MPVRSHAVEDEEDLREVQPPEIRFGCLPRYKFVNDLVELDVFLDSRSCRRMILAKPPFVRRDHVV